MMWNCSCCLNTVNDVVNGFFLNGTSNIRSKIFYSPPFSCRVSGRQHAIRAVEWGFLLWVGGCPLCRLTLCLMFCSCLWVDRAPLALSVQFASLIWVVTTDSTLWKKIVKQCNVCKYQSNISGIEMAALMKCARRRVCVLGLFSLACCCCCRGTDKLTCISGLTTI